MAVALWDVCGPGIYIDSPAGDYTFGSDARLALNCLRSRPVGLALLQAITTACNGQAGFFGRKNKRTVVIEKAVAATAVPTQDTSVAFRAQLNMPGNGILADPAFALTVRGQGGCKGAIARWNPSNKIPGTEIERPSFLSLAHELIHCLHFITGDCGRAPTRQFDLTKDSGLAEEEARTIGLGPYNHPHQSDAICENSIRIAFGQPRRNEYAPGVPLTQAQRT
jgi:hypothetical protein